MLENIQRLRLLGLPVFDNIENLAALIRVDSKRLTILVLQSERFYRTYRIPKRSSGWRKISSPSKEIKAIQAWILRNILDKLSPSAYATGYILRKRLVDNVNPHASNRFFLSVDIRDFFPMIGSWRIRRLFEVLGYSEMAAVTLTRLCTYFGGLPQGGVTSPALSNLVCLKVDRRLGGLASHRNMVFTRYADDITFSTNNRNALCRVLTLVFEIIRNEGFEPNLEKVRLLGPRTQCRITGLVKNSSEARFGIGKKKKIRMRAVMHNLLVKGRHDSTYPDGASIEGWLSFLKGVDPGSHEQMTRYWNTLKAKYGSKTR
ncbi:MAG: RNA-directed DNA polymerase [Ignavibacteriae bacterium]|nr:RNA-directed DNA polymerase [Ignavibacteriota bacterium]